MLRSVKDVVDAVDAGRVHTQRFFKNLNTVTGDVWTDWSYASGQPAFDARIGDAATFTPAVSSRNDAIWFPDIPAGMERRILSIAHYGQGGASAQTTRDMQMYDLAGYYPLLDGDSTDLQEMDNTLTLPRYVSGEGVFPVIINQVAPAVSVATATVTYTNSDGVAGRTVDWRVVLGGLTKSCHAPSATGTAPSLVCNLASGDRGVRSIESIQFLTPPGGLFAVYLVKLLASLPDRSGDSNSLGIASERQFLMERSFNMPLVPDGATLGFFVHPGAGARTFSLFGNVTFVWG